MENYDLVIIGAGGVGLSAAMYSARLGLKSLVLGAAHGSELPIGGVITTTNTVENYPGFTKISGMQLAKKIEEHTKSYKLATIKQEKVIDVKTQKNCFQIKTGKNQYKAKALIFATGTKLRKLTVPGAEKYERRGINYCALCDGPVYKDKTVAVLGGSDSAAIDALILSEYAKKVYIIYRGEKIHPEPINLKKVEVNKKIEIINNTNITEVKGNGLLKEVILDNPYNGKNSLKLDAVFIAIGMLPLSDLAKKIGVKLNKRGEIMIDHRTSSTNVKGVFAAGDITDGQFKQLITGVGQGVTAAYSAYEYIANEKVEFC